MRGQSTGWIIAIVIIVILIIGGIWWYGAANPSATSQTGGATNTAEETQVRTTVTGFGQALQFVPLMASTSAVTNAMQQYYGPYVAPELITEWEGMASTAPGRLTSSPWPARIDITSVSKNSDGSYTVLGNIVNVTSATITSTSSAAVNTAIALHVENRNGTWLITGFQLR